MKRPNIRKLKLQEKKTEYKIRQLYKLLKLH